MKRIFSIMFNRVFMVAVAIILQFSWLFLTLYDFSVRFTFVDIGTRILDVYYTSFSASWQRFICRIRKISTDEKHAGTHGRRS